MLGKMEGESNLKSSNITFRSEPGEVTVTPFVCASPALVVCTARLCVAADRHRCQPASRPLPYLRFLRRSRCVIDVKPSNRQRQIGNYSHPFPTSTLKPSKLSPFKPWVPPSTTMAGTCSHVIVWPFQTVRWPQRVLDAFIATPE